MQITKDIEYSTLVDLLNESLSCVVKNYNAFKTLSDLEALRESKLLLGYYSHDHLCGAVGWKQNDSFFIEYFYWNKQQKRYSTKEYKEYWKAAFASMKEDGISWIVGVVDHNRKNHKGFIKLHDKLLGQSQPYMKGMRIGRHNCPTEGDKFFDLVYSDHSLYRWRISEALNHMQDENVTK